MFINVGKQLIEQKLYTMADHQSQIEKELQENDFFIIQIILKNYKKIKNKIKLINEKKIKRIYNQ